MRSALLLVSTLALGLACGGPSAPPRRVDYQPAPDGGLPPPSPSSKKGVIVPSDLGVSPGTSAPATPPTLPPATSSPGIN